MSRKKVLYVPTSRHTDLVFSREDLAKLKNGFEVVFNRLEKDFTSQEVAERIKGFDALITGWGSPTLTEEVFENADQLKIIAHSAGSVRYMLPEDVLRRHVIPRKICVCNAPKAIAHNVAETTLCLLIMTSRRLVDQITYVREKSAWRNPDIPLDTKSLNGSTVGIIGAGTVGREVIRLMKPFDVRILVYDPYLSEEEAGRLNVEKTNLEDLFHRSDFVSVHAPLTESTRHMVNEHHLKLLHDGAVLVNTSRGQIVDEDALVRECQAGRILVAVDVTDPEPPPEDSPLRKLEQVILTPHIAGAGSYGYRKIGKMTVKAIEDFFAGREVENTINLEQINTLA